MIAVLRLLHRLTHPGEARRIRHLDHAHRDQDGQRVPLVDWRDELLRYGIEVER